MPEPTAPKLRDEILAGQSALSSYYKSLQVATALPMSIDDVEADFRLDIYARMKRDPAAASALGAITTNVLAEGVRFLNRLPAPSVVKPNAAAYAKYAAAEEIRTELERMFDRLQQPLEDILREMLDCLAMGHKLAEQVYSVEGDRVVLKRLRVKPRQSYVFVVDGVMECLGVVASKPGLGTLTVTPHAEVQSSEIIGRRKFFLLTNGGEGGDPRGESLLRPAYNAWWNRQQIYPAFLKFQLQFGTPSLVGEVAPDASGYIADNGEEITAKEAMARKLAEFQNGTAMAIDNGASVTVINPQGNGENFINALKYWAQEMKEAILIAARATSEAQYGSRADSQTASDVVDDVASAFRRRVEMAFYRDVILPLVQMNWGNEAAEELSPFLSLSDLSPEETTERGNMIANLARANFLHPSQYPGIDASLDLPERDFEAQMADLQAEREAEADQRQMMAGLSDWGGKGGNRNVDETEE